MSAVEIALIMLFARAGVKIFSMRMLLAQVTVSVEMFAPLIFCRTRLNKFLSSNFLGICEKVDTVGHKRRDNLAMWCLFSLGHAFSSKHTRKMLFVLADRSVILGYHYVIFHILIFWQLPENHEKQI